MKKYTLTLLILTSLKISSLNQRSELSLLNEKSNFDNEILDPEIEKSFKPSDVIMLRVSKPELQTKSDSTALEVGVTTLDRSSFIYFSFVHDKYFGFFNYQNHLVLVYGDDSPSYFFNKTTAKKSFEFMPMKAYVIDRNHPPIPIEANLSLYSYKNGKFKSIDTRLGFYR
jgi:hypothetical protein